MDLDFFEGLDTTQLEFINNLLSTVITQEEEVTEAKQIREVVPIEAWLNSTYYLGNMAKDLYPYWKRKLIQHSMSGSPEIILTGSIGTGKSTAAYVYFIRKLYELSCYDNPQSLFGLSERSHIFFVYLSITHRHALLSGFGEIRDMIDTIPYFEKNFKRDDKIDSVLRFPNNISIIPGTDNLSVISLNLFGCIQDEADFKRKGPSGKVGDVERAHKIYSEITDRRTSRFMDHGFDPGFSAIISSSTYESSFVSTRMKNASKTGSTAISSTLYEVKPNKYSKEYFCVFKGSEQYDAFIVKEIQDILDIASEDIQSKIRRLYMETDKTGSEQIRYVIERLPSKFINNFVFPPVDFRNNFENDIYTALNNISGVTIVKSGRLFSSKAIWNSNIDYTLRHPFTRETIELSVLGTDSIMDFFLPEVLFQEIADERGNFVRWKLRRDPYRPRFVHIDQSTSKDSTAIAITHPSCLVEDPDTLLRVPVVELDLALVITPQKNGRKVSIAKQISIAKIRKFVFQLRSMGMQFGKLTYDQFQSSDSLQIMIRKGIKADRQSVDRDDSQYLQFVDILTENRFKMYNYPLFKKEFFNLLHDGEKRKVDHPEYNDDGTEGTKDISDAIVGSTNLSLAETKMSLTTPEEIMELYKSPKKDVFDKDKFGRMINANYDQIKKGSKITGFIGEEYGSSILRR